MINIDNSFFKVMKDRAPRREFHNLEEAMLFVHGSILPDRE